VVEADGVSAGALGVVAQAGIESKLQKRFNIVELQALMRPSAGNPEAILGQHAQPCLGRDRPGRPGRLGIIDEVSAAVSGSVTVDASGVTAALPAAAAAAAATAAASTAPLLSAPSRTGETPGCSGASRMRKNNLKAVHHIFAPGTENMRGRTGVNLGSTCTTLPGVAAAAAAAASAAAESVVDPTVAATEAAVVSEDMAGGATAADAIA
jgi:hypothetical protein